MPAKVNIKLTGVRETQQFLYHQPRVIKGLVGTAIQTASKEVYKEIVANASRRDKTLLELKQQNHPFARWGGHDMGRAIGREWVKKPWMIHTRTGALRKSIKYKFVTGERLAGSGVATVFYYDYQGAGHVKYVVKGTEIMFPRDVIMETLRMNESKIKKKIRKLFGVSWNKRTKIRRTLESSKTRGGGFV